MYGIKNSLGCVLKKIFFLAWGSSACKVAFVAVQ